MATELGQAYVQIMPSAKGIKGMIEKELGVEVSSAGESAGKSLGSNLVSTLKKVMIAAGIGKIISSAINAGGELEQNLGGTEAVFGDFAKEIQNSAKSAYKNMGLSASDYMATANKMGSLFQGSGVEQQRALELTSDAMQRAADVASVMGIDTSAAMESIAGAAKGNFTMMDNLGVAMNATTLQAYALEKGINFDWKTADNAAKSELAMKMFMDRTSQYSGNFAKESAETFSGSLGAMKSAWTDTLAGMSTGQDMSPLLNNLATTVVNFAKNLIPMILNVVSALPGAIVTFLTVALPQFIAMGSQLINQIAQGIVTGLPGFMTQLDALMLSMQTWVTTQLPTLIQNGVQWIVGLASGLMGGLPNVLTNIGEIILNLLSALMDAWPSIMQGGFDLITGLAKGILDNLPAVGESIQNILGKLLQLIVDKGPSIIRKGFELIGKLAKGLWDNLPEIINTIGNIIAGLLGKIHEYLPKLLDKGWELIKELAAGLWKALPDVLNKGREIVDALVNKIKGMFGALKDAGWDLIRGLWNGISDAKAWIISKIGGFVDSVVGSIKSFFGINSPSKVFAEIGMYLDQGLAEGIEDNVKPISKAMDGIQDLTNRSFESAIAMNATTSTSAIRKASESGLIGGNSETTNKAANIVFSIGGHKFKAFVDDISKLQDRETELELAY